MSYSRAGVEKFTIIDDLPDIDDLESSSGYNGPRANQPGADPPSDAKLSKFIRGSHVTPKNSGMHAMERYEEMPQQHMDPRTTHDVDSRMDQHMMDPRMGQHVDPRMGQHMMGQHMMGQHMMGQHMRAPTCLEIADHVANCPVCSSLYKNDRTMYVLGLGIFLLTILCLFLWKKVIDTY